MEGVPTENADGGDWAKRGEALRGALRRFLARRVADAAEVDDLVQDTFLRIVRRGNVDQLEHFEAYLFETAASVVKDRARRRRVRHADKHVPFETEIHGGEAPSPEVTALGRDALRTTTLALMELPERTRNVFVLRRLEGLSFREISLRLGISVSAVEKHMVRALRSLVSHLELRK